MSNCTDVCEIVMDTLMHLGYDIKTDEGDEDHTDVLDAFCAYNQSYTDLYDACKYALDAVEDSELYPQDATDKLIAAIAKAKQ